MNFIKSCKSITPLQERDACLALAFLFLLFWLVWRLKFLVYLAMAALLLGMIWAKSMRPFACLWFGLSSILGGFMSRILLGAIWFLLVTPMGLVRRAMGKDSLRLKEWKKDTTSAFVIRDHKYSSSDLENPY